MRAEIATGTYECEPGLCEPIGMVPMKSRHPTRTSQPAFSWENDRKGGRCDVAVMKAAARQNAPPMIFRADGRTGD